MKRKTRFFVGLAAAALTFGSLMATLGPAHFNKHRHGCHAQQCSNGQHVTPATNEDK